MIGKRSAHPAVSGLGSVIGPLIGTSLMAQLRFYFMTATAFISALLAVGWNGSIRRATWSLDQPGSDARTSRRGPGQVIAAPPHLWRYRYGSERDSDRDNLRNLFATNNQIIT